MSTTILPLSLPPTPPIPARSALRRKSPNTEMLSFFPSTTNSTPFPAAYENHPYASLADYESDYEPLLPGSASNPNPFRDPSVSGESRISSSTQDTNTWQESSRVVTVASERRGRGKHTNMYAPPPPPASALPSLDDDETIIPAIITNVIPAAKSTLPVSPTMSDKKSSLIRSPSFLKKLRKEGEAKDGKEEKGVLKVVYMPRKEYKRWFARGLRGEYTGSEPYRRWSEEELEEQFGRFRPVKFGLGRGKK